jgi:hypothetical protein
MTRFSGPGQKRPIYKIRVIFYGKHGQLYSFMGNIHSCFFFNVAITANYFPNVTNYHWQQIMLIPRLKNRFFPSFTQQTAYKIGKKLLHSTTTLTNQSRSILPSFMFCEIWLRIYIHSNLFHVFDIYEFCIILRLM